MSNSEFNKNDKQVFFNQVRGRCHELKDSGNYGNVVIQVGHNNPRFCSFSFKKEQLEEVKKHYTVGNKVLIKFFISSHKRGETWITSANLLSIEPDLGKPQG